MLNTRKILSEHTGKLLFLRWYNTQYWGWNQTGFEKMGCDILKCNSLPQTFVQLYPVWKNSRVSTRTKLRIFRNNVKSVLLYGSETWKEMKSTTSKLQTFVSCCLRRILNIHWLEVISNEELWRRTGEIEMSMQIKRRKWNWKGHTLTKGHEAIEREALD
jgi:hypothetical protein